MITDDMTGQVAIVTGASRGIGRSIAASLLELGVVVAGIDISEMPPSDVIPFIADVSREPELDEVISKIEQTVGSASILIMNAAVVESGLIEETTTTSWNRLLAVNLTGAFFCARRVLPAMRRQRYGRVVAVGSVAGITGGSGQLAAYAASKAGMMALTKSLALEYAPYGITSNVVAPAFIQTEMMSGNRRDELSVPVGRLGTVEDVADVVTFLCKPSAGYITGSVIDINGGTLIR